MLLKLTPRGSLQLHWRAQVRLWKEVSGEGVTEALTWGQLIIAVGVKGARNQVT